jgi:FtsH-binding integral membrane protein
MATIPTTTAASASLSRDEAGRLFGQTMGLVALTAGLFALGSYLGRHISGGWAILAYVAAFAVLLGMNAAAKRSEQLAVTLLFGFGLLLGLAVAPTIAYYVGADPQAVWEAGGATALFIAGFGAAASIFLDILNVFLLFLSIFSGGDE